MPTPKYGVYEGFATRFTSDGEIWVLFGDRSPAVAMAHLQSITRLLSVVIAHDEAGFQFFDGPRWREAACRHNH